MNEKAWKPTGKSRYKTAHNLLLFWTLFIGIGAVGGAACMIADPNGGIMGMDAMLPYFQKLPFAEVLFQNFLFSGFALLIVNGLTNLIAAYLLLKNEKSGIVLGGFFGITLMAWICIQFYMFPLNFMSTAYFVFGLAQALTGYAAFVFYRQEKFASENANFDYAGENHNRLVVYFSRMGYVRKVALDEARRTGADLYEIKSTELTQGTAGFWWCGRYGMHRWKMPIEEIGVNLKSYEHVTVCTPIWVFGLAAPIRAFCDEARGKIKSVDYILVHHNNSSYVNAADEMDSILNIKRTGFVSIRCRCGSFKKVN